MPQCPDCNCGHSFVRNVIQTSTKIEGVDHSVTRRYRICRHCGNTFITVEVVEDLGRTGLPAPQFRPGPTTLVPVTKRSPPKKKRVPRP